MSHLKIDQNLSLAINIQANPGVYGLLIGSGVSRSAEIPTGWDITLDLISRIAVGGGDKPKDPKKWFTEKYNKDPDYSDLLEEIAPTAAERQAILKGFFEPTPEEKDQGVKIPQPAHRAIAKLVGGGHVKLIITTNFDQLLEIAIRELGVTPTVISTADQAKGAPPLTHTKCTIIKINGDYLDQRLLNTEAELSKYAPEMDRLLDKAFDDFGIIACGWSAEWDIALRAAIERATNRRYSFYFCSRGRLGPGATKIVEGRNGQRISIDSADNFFTELAETIETLEGLGPPNPLGVEVLTARAKKYLADESAAISLHDLTVDAVQAVVDQTSRTVFPVNVKSTAEDFVERVAQIERISYPICRLAAVFGQWMPIAQVPTAQYLVQRLASTNPDKSGCKDWTSLETYPAVLAMYSLGVNAVAHGNYNLLRQVMESAMPGARGEGTTIGLALNTRALGSLDSWRQIPGLENRKTPRSDRIRSTIDSVIPGLTPNGVDSDEFFDRYEYLVALNYGYETHDGKDHHRFWAPLGRFLWRDEEMVQKKTSERFTSEFENLGDQWPPLLAGFFGGTVSGVTSAIEAMDSFLLKVDRY